LSELAGDVATETQNSPVWPNLEITGHG